MSIQDQLLRLSEPPDEDKMKAMYLEAIEESDGDLKLIWFENGIIEGDKRIRPLIEALIEGVKHMRHGRGCDILVLNGDCTCGMSEAQNKLVALANGGSL